MLALHAETEAELSIERKMNGRSSEIQTVDLKDKFIQIIESWIYLLVILQLVKLSLAAASLPTRGN